MATGRIGTTPVLQVRWSKAPTNGTTSLSGLDDNSVSLVYSVGYEAVYRNGVLLSRGNDYTATNGTTVTLIDATITGDIIEIFANQTVPLSDTFSQTVADGRFIKNTLTTTTGDIIYASGANTPARLGIGSSAQVLTVSGGIPAWATPAVSTSGMTLITRQTITASSGTNIDSVFTTTYKTYMIIFEDCDGSSGQTDLYLQFRYGSTTMAQGYKYKEMLFSSTQTNTERNGINQIILTPNLGGSTSDSSAGQIMITRVAVSDYPMFWFDFNDTYSGVPISGRGLNDQQQTYTGIRVSPSTGTFDAKVAIYGLAS